MPPYAMLYQYCANINVSTVYRRSFYNTVYAAKKLTFYARPTATGLLWLWLQACYGYSYSYRHVTWSYMNSCSLYMLLSLLPGVLIICRDGYGRAMATVTGTPKGTNHTLGEEELLQVLEQMKSHQGKANKCFPPRRVDARCAQLQLHTCSLP